MRWMVTVEATVDQAAVEVELGAIGAVIDAEIEAVPLGEDERVIYVEGPKDLARNLGDATPHLLAAYPDSEMEPYGTTDSGSRDDATGLGAGVGTMSEKLAIDREGDVVVLTMDDGRANALGPDLTAAISAAVAEASADESVVAIVLAGRDGRFSGGFDLDVIGGGDVGAIGAMVTAGGSLVRQLYGCDVPVIAACTGHAVAAGALLLLGCDVRIGPDASVKIGLNEVAIGMTLPGWALTIAGERLSKRHLQRSIVNARLVDGNGGVDAGFLDQVVVPDAVIDAAIAEAKTMAALDRSAYVKTVAAVRGEVLATMDRQLAADRADFE